jgi:2-C-methyl-D-erythritol 4-phosphate cytidylyltransferase
MMNADAVIVSAGKGLRFVEGKPTKVGTSRTGRRTDTVVPTPDHGKKQFTLLEGKPILAHTLDKFEACSLIRSVRLVVGQEDMDYCLKEIVEKYRFRKVSKIVPGGKWRQESVKNGIDSLPKDTDIVVIHDGVRPLVTQAMIEDSIHSAVRYGAVVLAIPVKETIKVSNPDGTVLKTLDRESLWQIQTPQTFQINVIREAHSRAIEDGFVGTDDASLVERLGGKVHILPGSQTNIKITTPEDFVLANLFLKMNTLSKQGPRGGTKGK